MPPVIRPQRPKRRPWPAIAAVVVVLVIAGVLGLWRLTWQAPTWWAEPDSDHEQTIVLADRVEYRLAEEALRWRAAQSAVDVPRISGEKCSIYHLHPNL